MTLIGEKKFKFLEFSKETKSQKTSQSHRGTIYIRWGDADIISLTQVPQSCSYTDHRMRKIWLGAIQVQTVSFTQASYHNANLPQSLHKIHSNVFFFNLNAINLLETWQAEASFSAKHRQMTQSTESMY